MAALRMTFPAAAVNIEGKEGIKRTFASSNFSNEAGLPTDAGAAFNRQAVLRTEAKQDPVRIRLDNTLRRHTEP